MKHDHRTSTEGPLALNLNRQQRREMEKLQRQADKARGNVQGRGQAGKGSGKHPSHARQVDAFTKVTSRNRPYTEDEANVLYMRQASTLEAISKGEAKLDDVLDIYFAMRTLEEVYREQVPAETEEQRQARAENQAVACAAADCLHAAMGRIVSDEDAARSILLDGAGLQALRAALVLYDDILRVATRMNLVKALRKVMDQDLDFQPDLWNTSQKNLG